MMVMQFVLVSGPVPTVKHMAALYRFRLVVARKLYTEI